jgi:hypothetical protein
MAMLSKLTLKPIFFSLLATQFRDPGRTAAEAEVQSSERARKTIFCERKRGPPV